MQRIKQTSCRSKQSNRRGLAPLELVLSLPIMLFVMALIIDFGNMAPWKVRAAAVAREAVWREHWPHRGGNNPVPAGWAKSNSQTPTAQMPFKDASFSRGEAQPDVLSSDPFAQHAVVRGPSVMPNQNNPLIVDTTKINFPDGLVQGTSHIEIRLPLLPGLPHVVYNLRHVLLDGQFQFGPMGYPDNQVRRSTLLYQFQTNPQLERDYSQAAQQVYQLWANRNPTEFSPTTAGVMTLGEHEGTSSSEYGDDEFRNFFGSSPGFHPRVGASHGSAIPCETDREEVRLNHVIGPRGVVDRIQGTRRGGRGGVPDRMASAFIAMYQEQIRQLQAQQPPPQAQIDAFQKKIDQLNQFKGSLF